MESILAATFAEIVIHAVTAVGLIEWVKKISKLEKSELYPAILPAIALMVAASILYAPAMIWLRIWSISQLAYPVLVQLPERLIKGKV